MSADIIRFDDITESWERDKRVMNMRLAGIPPREIAEHEGCGIDEVEASVARMSGGVSPHFRERHMQLSLERLDKLLRAHYQAALRGNYDASVIYLRAIEMSGRFLGLFPPPHTETSLDKLKPKVTSTEEIREVLDELVGKNRTIEGDVVDKGGDDG
jgi:hypothetical protein